MNTDIITELCSAAATPPAPRWANAPDWARFVAMDADGQWCWYENRPSPDTELGSDEFTLWDVEDGRMSPISSGIPFDGWENSLQERPAPTAIDIITELRSAASTLCTPMPAGFVPMQDKVTAELLERAANEIEALRYDAATSSSVVHTLQGENKARHFAWFTPDEKLPESGARVLAHVVQAAGSTYAVEHDAPEGWQAFEIAEFFLGPNGCPNWSKATYGEVVHWAPIDPSQVDAGSEKWI